MKIFVEWLMSGPEKRFVMMSNINPNEIESLNNKRFLARTG